MTGFGTTRLLLILAAVGVTALPRIASAGFDEGLRAFERADFATATREFQAAADAGHAGALYYLGRMRLMAEGGPADYKQAVMYLRKAAERGNANAQYYLGVLYYRGIAVKRDYAEAVRWYSAAAAQGDHVSQYSLGVMYAAGSGVPKDNVQALAWFIRAAAGGDKLAAKFEKLLKPAMSAEDIATARRQAREALPERVR